MLCLPPHEAAGRAGWAGVPYPHVDVALADTATGEHLEGPETGELLVRGPGLFTGYFRDPEATAAVLHDGWLWTGDVAVRDEQGYLRIVDRLRNIYISGGENVAPAEVEGVLRRHPAVADAAVVGVPHPRWGEAGVALVVVRPGVATDEQDLLDHCRRELAAFSRLSTRRPRASTGWPSTRRWTSSRCRTSTTTRSSSPARARPRSRRTCARRSAERPRTVVSGTAYPR